MRNILKVLKKVYSVFEQIAKWFWYAAGAAFVLMAVIVTAGAIARYAFRTPWARSYDLTLILILVGAMLAMPYVQCRGENLRLDLLDSVFHPTVTKWIKGFLGPILGTVFTAALAKECWAQTTFAFDIGEKTRGNFPMPSYPFKFIIALCVALLCVIMLLQILMFLFGLGQPEPADGAGQPDSADSTGE